MYLETDLCAHSPTVSDDRLLERNRSKQTNNFLLFCKAIIHVKRSALVRICVSKQNYRKGNIQYYERLWDQIKLMKNIFFGFNSIPGPPPSRPNSPAPHTDTQTTTPR